MAERPGVPALPVSAPGEETPRPETDPEATVPAIVVTALRTIAGGYWNVGRKPGNELTAREYAQEALHAAGLAVRL